MRFASAWAFALAAASKTSCSCAATWALTRSARESSVITLVRPVSSTERLSVSAASAGEARVPMTPVVASVATPAMPTPRRAIRLGARCFPVARVNAM